MIQWTRVRDGEAHSHGVKDPNGGWVGRVGSFVYFVWVQKRVRDEGSFYAAARVVDGQIERYGGLGDSTPRPPGVSPWSSWSCDEGSFGDAKRACAKDAKGRGAT